MKYRAKIKPDLCDSIPDDKDFLLAIQLARVVNGLRSNMRTLLGVSNETKMIATKDRLDLMLIHGAMLYEAIKTFSSFGKRYKDLKIFDIEKDKFKEIQIEHGDKNSFRNTVLHRIRNKVFFHFDKEVVPETLPKLNLVNEINFLQANSTNNKDIIYSLSDDIVLSYITDIETIEGNDVERYSFVEDKIIHISKLLGELIDKIIAELLEEKLELHENIA